MAKPEYHVSENGIRAHLMGKVEEWVQDEAPFVRNQFKTLEEAEQAFKDWLWGTNDGTTNKRTR